ncbi:TIGR02281 family clan AA aspartic protease [Sphingomonas sp. 1P06PA]|uniref:retropepsin-like aspartic protease family protein n=1 Tax=Sphingomonas sp. 1P06PA TaxID=554121 RepID=UPI0039A48049
MTGDDLAQGLILSSFLLVMLSSLVARRLAFGKVIQMALGWLAIFTAAIAIYAYREEARAVGNRMLAALDPEAGEKAGSTLRIPMGPDGHFWIRATVNGEQVRFLIDSGATTTALSSETVRTANVARRSKLPVMLDTANGSVRADRVTIDRLVVGEIERRDFAAVSAEAFGNINVLGMNFLSSLGRWGVEGRTLILEP